MPVAPPDWSVVECVLLDMDGTVLDLAFDNFIWMQAVPSRYAERRGLSLEAARAELAPQFMSVAHTLPWYDLNYWTRLTGVDLAALHDEFRDRVGILEGSVAFLDAVRASGRPMWLTTNAHPDSWRPKLAQTGLAHYFDHIVSSDDLKAPKEDPRYWQGLRDRYGMNAARCLFADDSRRVLEAARRFGIGQIVAMTHPDTTRPPHVFEDFFSVARLHELLPVPPLHRV
ncbi:GMP/IMP nucleotidase [Panacagrimonas sp.]|uniref:GMP/IMP nucleotidase n=1 Tax=Panacagrimonas sp. TaxID=2480088 RepID=UPI003B51C878